MLFATDPPDIVPPSIGIPPTPAGIAPAAPRRPLWRRVLRPKRIALVLLLLFLALLGWLAITAPLSRSLRPIAPPAVTLLAGDGQVIARRGAIVERPVDVRRLPPYVGDAFVGIEDRRFYRHWGVDPHGIARALWHDMLAGGMREGGSTITQQLAKLVFLSSDRNFGRKAREVLIAFWMEARLSKPEILSRYLSEAYFGDNVYGLRAAARHYFDVAPEHLSLGEAAMLAGLMKAPSRLAPGTNPVGARNREALVLDAMVSAGLIPAERARIEPPVRLHLRAERQAPNGGYFADWVLPAARTQDDDPYAPQTVRTTLDARLQRAAEAATGRALPAGAQVALVAMKPDGRVVAMVGGRHYDGSPFNRAVQARRQPGSTFKLFVYLAALRAGMTPDDRIADEPVTIGGWSPVNADRTYRGRITLREAFARSSNVAAVRLTQQVGPRAVAAAARDLGIASPLAADDASIALGTSGVTLLELTSAYASVANGAYPVRPRGLPPAEEGWFDRLRNRQRTIDARTAAMLRDLLSATVSQGTARAAALDRPVFGKTGTSQDNRDALFVGFAGGLVTAVWIGRDDNMPMKGIAGGGLPARIWRTFMAEALGARPLAAKTPDTADPDSLDHLLDAAGLGNLQLDDIRVGNVAIGLHLDHDGLHVSAKPRGGDHPAESEGGSPDDE